VITYQDIPRSEATLVMRCFSAATSAWSCASPDVCQIPKLLKTETGGRRAKARPDCRRRPGAGAVRCPARL